MHLAVLLDEMCRQHSQIIKIIIDLAVFASPQSQPNLDA